MNEHVSLAKPLMHQCLTCPSTPAPTPRPQATESRTPLPSNPTLSQGLASVPPSEEPDTLSPWSLHRWFPLTTWSRFP